MAGANDSAQAKPRRRPGRVPTSCAECRRLKLRCDRNVPCEKCVSRGCGSICPDGCLTPGKGNRLVLANTEELHDRIDKLCARIRELEEALKILQATVSDDPHPLLRNDLLTVKVPHSTTTTPSKVSKPAPIPSPTSSLAASASVPPPPTISPIPIPVPPPLVNNPSGGETRQPKVEDENFIDSFGTLTIGPRGEANFLGQTARSEYLIRASTKRPRPHLQTPPPRFSRRLVDASCPEIDLGVNRDVLQEVISYIPPQSESERLCEVYLEFGRFLFPPLLRKELQEEVLNVVYSSESFDTLQVHHALALLYVILAIAVLFDPSRPPYSDDAHEYFLLSRAALNLSTPLVHTTLNSILTMMHLAQYLELRDWESVGSNQAWHYVGFACRLAFGIGLHLNSSRWHLCEDATERRSRVFWQLFSLETWMSFSFGRPPSSFLAYVDCEFPKNMEEVTNAQGQPEIGFHPWCWRYSALLASVVSTAFVPKPPPYTTILELDRKIRDFPIPTHLRPRCQSNEPLSAAAFDVQRWFVLCAKEAVLLNLHRGYFAQALQEQPVDFLKHRFGPSMLATYRSAWRIIETVVCAWRDNPLPMSRVAMSWSQALSASIVMCLLATRAPTSNLTSSALEELDRALAAFEEAAPTCRSASVNLDAMRTLRNKAHAAVNRTHIQDPSPSITPAELDRLGGKTHLIVPCSTTNDGYVATSSRSSSVTLTEGNMDHLFAGMNMHPTIAQDLRNLDIGAPLFNQLSDFPPATGAASSPTIGSLVDSISIGQPQPMQDVQFIESLWGSGVGCVNGVGAMGGASGMVGVGGMSGLNGLNGLNMSPYQSSPSPFNGTNSASPALDAVWQSLVEHLGFS